jgi:hypothetical protein
MSTERKALEYCIEQIQRSGKPGSEVVIGAMTLWVAAHGDFDLPVQQVIVDNNNTELETLPPAEPISNLPIGTEGIIFGDKTFREPEVIDGEGIENNVELSSNLNAILAPYVTGTNTAVQLAEKLQNDRKTAEYEWQDTQVLNGKMTNVFFKAPYKTTGGYNEALGLEVTYTRRLEPHKRDLRILLDFKNGGVNTLTVKREDTTPRAFGYSVRQGILWELLRTVPDNQDHFPVQNGSWDAGILQGEARDDGMTHTFYLQEDAVRIVSNYPGLYTITRLFDSKANKFYSYKQRKKEKLPEISNHPLEPAVVTSFIAGLLSTLPRFNKNI